MAALTTKDSPVVSTYIVNPPTGSGSKAMVSDGSPDVKIIASGPILLPFDANR